MSPPPADPEAQAYIDEFQERLAQRGHFYRHALRVLYEDRVRRDLESLYQPAAPPQPRKPFLRRVSHATAHAGKQAGIWVAQRFAPSPRRKVSRDDPEVIEGSFVVLSEETTPIRTADPGDINPANGPIIHIYKENKENQP